MTPERAEQVKSIRLRNLAIGRATLASRRTEESSAERKFGARFQKQLTTFGKKRAALAGRLRYVSVYPSDRLVRIGDYDVELISERDVYPAPPKTLFMVLVEPINGRGPQFALLRRSDIPSRIVGSRRVEIGITSLECAGVLGLSVLGIVRSGGRA